jgi:hypothetical protein
MFAASILAAARAGGADGRTLAEIAEEIDDVELSEEGLLEFNSLTASFISSFARLYEQELITINYKSDNKLLDMTLSASKLFFSLLTTSLHDTVVTVTPRFNSIQEIIGFSLTDVIIANTGNTMRIRPVFSIPRHDSKTRCDVFVLMPFVAELKPIYDDHIKNACTESGLFSLRADDFFHIGHIMQDVWSAIYLAKWIIADCTGRNTNVFYELGIAHTLGKRVIIITQDENDVPFDIRHIRYFKYEFTPRGMKALETALVKVFKSEPSDTFAAP